MTTCSKVPHRGATREMTSLLNEAVMLFCTLITASLLYSTLYVKATIRTRKQIALSKLIPLELQLLILVWLAALPTFDAPAVESAL